MNESTAPALELPATTSQDVLTEIAGDWLGVKADAARKWTGIVVT